MSIWKYTPLDGLLVALSLAHFLVSILLARAWANMSTAGALTAFAVQVFLITYNTVVMSHLFTHNRWFRSPVLNSAASMLNSINIGQSVQAYELTHVRNHHRYNNDRQGPDGKTRDTSSTYRHGNAGGHVTLARYAFGGAVRTLLRILSNVFAINRFWRVGASEDELLTLAARGPDRRKAELRQVQFERLAHFLSIGAFFALSWTWVLQCYFPALFLSLILVNVQNYFEHFGASPENRYTDSVSYYGRLYNLLTFNDGYHQEHHLRPHAHWMSLPQVRFLQCSKPQQAERLVSPVPAILGLLDRGRSRLDREVISANDFREHAR